jgi:hypothetical protein
MAVETEVREKPRNDAYTGLLAISFLALVAATVLIVLDADQIGKPPGALKIDVPGVTPGKPGDPLQRPDAGKAKIDGGAPAPAPPMPMPPMPKPADKDKDSMSKAEPGKLPELPALDVSGAVVPAKAEVPADPDAPPLPVKPFTPPK